MRQALNRMGDRRSRVLALFWAVSLMILVPGLAAGNRILQISGVAAAAIYIVVLSWYLVMSEPEPDQRPDFPPIVRFFPDFRAMLVFVLLLTIGITGLACFLLGDGWLMLIISIPFSLIFVIAWRKRVDRKLIWAGLQVMILLAVSESLLGGENSSGLIMPLAAALMFLAGALLVRHTRLSRIRLLEGAYLEAGRSFLWGCLLAVPPALLNVVTIQWAPVSEFDLLFDRWWETFYALQPGIVEEVWARLLLTTLLFALLYPTSTDRPGRALFWSIGIAAFIHGMAHYPVSITGPEEGLFITLMYGVPLALLFVRRDLEQAVAYHFFIDFVRFAAFVIWNT